MGTAKMLWGNPEYPIQGGGGVPTGVNSKSELLLYCYLQLHYHVSRAFFKEDRKKVLLHL